MGATKRNVLGDAVSAIPKRTTAGHYVQFISDTLDRMDVSLYMKGFHVITDNIPIHSLDLVDSVMIERGAHICIPFFEFLGLFGQRSEPLWKSQ